MNDFKFLYSMESRMPGSARWEAIATFGVLDLLTAEALLRSRGLWRGEMRLLHVEDTPHGVVLHSELGRWLVKS